MVRTADEERAYWDAVDPVEDYARCIFDGPGPGSHGLSYVMDAVTGLPRGPWFDLGCGTGRLSFLAATLVERVDGFDISQCMIAHAIRSRFGAIPARFFECDGRTIPAPDETFAGGYSMLVFQHLEPETVAGYLREVFRVLRPGGRFVFQFAYDPEGSEGPYAFNHDPRDVTTWCDSAGLDPLGGENEYQFSRDESYPTWLWCVAEKPA